MSNHPTTDLTRDIIDFSRDAEGIVTVTINDPTHTTNTMTEAMGTALETIVERLERERESIIGVIVTSGKDTFFAGGDLALLRDAGPADVASISAGLDHYKACFRRLETLGRPVVAAINGTALGGGFEVALACHHRIVLDRPGVRVGLPEVTFGVLPGAGGVTRTVRLLGVTEALTKVLGEGRRMRPDEALASGVIDEVVDTEEALLDHARVWIRENPGATQPWDAARYRIPGGTPSSPTLAATLPAIGATVRRQLKGAPMPAPIAIAAAAVEGAQVDLDTAFAIETRYCANLICSQVSTNLIQALFFDLGEVSKGAGRPRSTTAADAAPQRPVRQLAVLGAGMMGAAIAYVAANAGVRVVLRDLTPEAAERGKDYSRGLVDKQVRRGRISAEAATEILDRITTTDLVADIAGSDAVIEAVFEDLELKRKVFTEAQAYLDDDTLVCSNTSALSIGELAAAVEHPEAFVGLHFFSPVDKMPLVEIIVGANTDADAVARAFDLARLLGKTPIVVSDRYGFYANRVLSRFVDEALSLVAEGVHPASAEQAALQAGFPVGALTLFDEINMKTIRKIREGFIADAAARGTTFVPSLSYPLVDRMLDEFDRPGRLEGRGFYEYDDSGSRMGLWPRLVAEYHREDVDPPIEEMTDRMLIAAALEAVRCLDEGVVRSVAEANVGAILGIGYPAWTGGPAQFVDQFPGGVAGFVARADELRARFGDRFEVPDTLRERARIGTTLR